MDLSKVTRFEVVDHTGENTDMIENYEGLALVYRQLGVSAELSLQDDGRTLKVFLADSEIATAEEVRAEMVAGLAGFVGRTMEEPLPE